MLANAEIVTLVLPRIDRSLQRKKKAPVAQYIVQCGSSLLERIAAMFGVHSPPLILETNAC